MKDGLSVAPYPLIRRLVTVNPTVLPRPYQGCDLVFVVVPIVNDVDALDWSAGRPNRHPRYAPGRKFASVARVLCDTDGLRISTTAPPDECPVAFTKIQFPAGALDLYVNNPYVPSSSVFSGVVLYPTPLFDTVTCVTPANFLDGVTNDIVPKSMNVAGTTSISDVCDVESK